MGRTYITTLADVTDKGLVLEIRCSCGRIAWLAAAGVIGRRINGAQVFGWHRWDEVLRQMRCRGCNQRGARAKARYPSEIGVPKGVPVIAFLRADDRERKRMVREARG